MASKPDLQSNAADTPTSKTPQAPKPRKQNKPRPNYAHIHRQPLPLQTYPLPTFHPTNPISLFRLAYTYLSQILSPPSSHPEHLYIGYYSPETGGVHITDPVHARALWEMGFFGKGTLSRSEPSWLEREKARLQVKGRGGMTAEEVTNARRAKRKDFKLERARAEAERIALQRDVETGKVSAEEAARRHAEAEAAALAEEVAKVDVPATQSREAVPSNDDDLDEEPEILENQEHLQLTPHEAFFLSYGLGVLDIRYPPNHQESPSASLGSPYTLLKNFAGGQILDPSSSFLLNYVVYHHFRSLGWVVRPGIKFGVDWLLYYRGPVFSHAEFAVIIIPSYSKAKKVSAENAGEVQKQKDWWWLHCVNRVQSQVLKSLVLCYVDVPESIEENAENVGELLGKYKVREFVIRRWVANRMRD